MNLPLNPYYELENMYALPTRERLHFYSPLSIPNVLSPDQASPILLKTFGEDHGITYNFLNGSLPDRYSAYQMSPNHPHNGFLTNHNIGHPAPSPFTEPRSIPSPINMESQVVQKLEMKRERNRIAAQKCRKKKLERIAGLEHKVKNLKNENQKIIEEIRNLRDEVNALHRRVKKHVDTGCQMPPRCES